MRRLEKRRRAVLYGCGGLILQALEFALDAFALGLIFGIKQRDL